MDANPSAPGITVLDFGALGPEKSRLERKRERERERKRERQREREREKEKEREAAGI